MLRPRFMGTVFLELLVNLIILDINFRKIGEKNYRLSIKDQKIIFFVINAFPKLISYRFIISYGSPRII